MSIMSSAAHRSRLLFPEGRGQTHELVVGFLEGGHVGRPFGIGAF